MNLTTRLLLSCAVLNLVAACDRGPSAPPASQPTTPAQSQTTPAVAGPASRPLVGIPPVSREQYKPVPGKVGGRFVTDSLGEPKSFNPITSGETSTSDYTTRMFEGLTESDPFTGDVAPRIAEKWEVADDGVTWSFHLRKDVKFNDGVPLTAKDVVFTWNELVFDSNRPAGKEPRWPCSDRDIASVAGKPVVASAIDDHTVKFVTPTRNAIWPLMCSATGILPEHVYGKMARDGSFGSALSTDSTPEQIVGSGPYMLGSYERGQRVTLKRNPNYWRKDETGQSLPYVNEIVTQVTRDLNVMLLNFERNITDTYGVPTGKEVARLKPKQQESNFSLYQFGPDDGTSFIGFNMNLDAAKAGKVPQYKVDWFRDRRFREAISYAIDRDAQIKNIRRNLGYPQNAPQTLSPGPFKMDGFAPRPYDPEKAKALLTDMGFKPGPGGVVVDSQGRKLSFVLNTNSGNTTREEIVNFIRKDLEKVGIEVIPQFLEFNLIVDKLDNKFDWEAILISFTGGREPHFGANLWKSSGNLHLWWPEQKMPSFPWEKRIDDIFDAGIQELDPVKRKALYREWVQIVYDEQPVVYLTVGERVSALRNRFGNVFPAEVGGVVHNPEEIYQLSEK